MRNRRDALYLTCGTSAAVMKCVPLGEDEFRKALQKHDVNGTATRASQLQGRTGRLAMRFYFMSALLCIAQIDPNFFHRICLGLASVDRRVPAVPISTPWTPSLRVSGTAIGYRQLRR